MQAEDIKTAQLLSDFKGTQVPGLGIMHCRQGLGLVRADQGDMALIEQRRSHLPFVLYH